MKKIGGQNIANPCGAQRRYGLQVVAALKLAVDGCKDLV